MSSDDEDGYTVSRESQVLSLLDNLYTVNPDGTFAPQAALLNKLKVVVRYLSAPDKSDSHLHCLIGESQKVTTHLLPLMLQFRRHEPTVRHIAAVISEILAPLEPNSYVHFVLLFFVSFSLVCFFVHVVCSQFCSFISYHLLVLMLPFVNVINGRSNEA